MNVQPEVTKEFFEKITFNSFESQLIVYRDSLKNVDSVDTLIKFIKTDFVALCNFYIRMGDYAQSVSIIPEHVVDVVETHLVNYTIPEHFKSTIILHRDVLLELNKGKILAKEQPQVGTFSTSHFEKSNSILEDQLEYLQNKIVDTTNSLQKDKRSQKKLTRKLTLIQNPWDVYKQQYETLLSQFRNIQQAKIILEHTITVFNHLKQVSASIFENYNQLNSRLQHNVAHIYKDIDKTDSQKELLFFIDDQMAQDINFGNDQTQFTEELNTKISELEKIKVPISSEQGLLTLREIDLSKAVQKWFDYQIVPEIMDLLTIENSLKSTNGISLSNLKNNLLHAKNTEGAIATTKFKPILDYLQSDLSELNKKGEIILNRINEKVEKQLQVSNIFNEKSFLDVPFNSTLNLDSNTFFNSVKQPIQKGLSFFDAQLKKTAQFNSISSIELATQCLHNRMYKQDDEHYDSLFLNKKFIGDLFLIPRQVQEDTLQKTIEQWHQGFNKSAFVFGERLSGRSTFLDYTSKKYFGKNCVILQPNSVATIDGRKFKTTNNLKEALQYIKNNNLQSTKPAILIDDLELWRDEDFSLLTNVRALINFIETESDDAFVIVATTQSMQTHLDTRLEFSNTFSTLIDVSKTEKACIIEALMLRHGAAHRTLVGEDLESLSDNTIQKAIAKITRKYNNNIGHVLQAWTFHTFVQENEKLLFKDDEYEFPDFFSQQELMILKQASIFKVVSEFGLKRVTASRFESDFKSGLKRLINTKILLRDTLGHLYINPVILSDINLFINQRN